MSLYADIVPDKFIIANSSSFHPYSFLGDNGEPQGLLIDYWKEIGKQTGIPVEFILTDWADGLDNVKTGRADIHAGLLYSDERDKYLDFTIPLKLSLPTSLFVSNNVNVTSLYNLGDIPVGVIKEGFEEYFVRKKFS